MARTVQITNGSDNVKAHIHARTAEQAAELKKLRAAKKVKEQAAAREAAHDAANEINMEDKPAFNAQAEDATRHARAQAAADTLLIELGIHMPSGKRMFVALVISVALSAGAGVAIGNLTAYAVAGALSLTGSAFAAFAVWVLGVVLALFVGWKIGKLVGEYVIDGHIDRHYDAAKSKVAGWFGSSKEFVSNIGAKNKVAAS